MKKIFYIYILSGFILFCRCESLDIENTNQPDQLEALANSSDVKSLIDGATTNLFKHLVGFSGIYFNLLADQTSTTNAYRSFWGFADQPRLQLNNSSTNQDLEYHIGSNWSSLNNYIYSANTIIGLIEINNKQMNIDGVDKTQEMLATAYLVKGIAQGYLSLIFDKAYIVNPDSDLTALEFQDYNAVNTASLENIDTAISIATANTDIELRIHDAYSISSSEMIKVANSFAAKILISLPRTNAEISNTDYNKVLAYANKGITRGFSPPTNGGYEFFNNLQDWSTYKLSGGAGYLPTDQKVLYLFDNSYPKDYPTDTNVILGPANSSDPRLANYFSYSTDFGYLRESRGRELFTNYRHKRHYTDNDRGTLAGLSTDIFHTEELDYIKAEASLYANNPGSAKAILDASARATIGNQTTINSQQGIIDALFYEYSIELDLNSTIATQWLFMRRYDLLQSGTPTQYPVPGSELEITGDELYTFGGETNAGKEGTATGSNSWKN